MTTSAMHATTDAPDPVRDPARLGALRATGLLDSPPEPQFDRVTRLAAWALAAPVALVSLVDGTRQFFKSAVGLPEPWATRRQTPLSHSFCQHVVRGGTPLVVGDARRHALVRDNLAVRELGVVAYLGVPLRAPGGDAIGAVCAIDGEPRGWSLDERGALADLTGVVESELALRHAVEHDALTGIANRRRFYAAVEAALGAAARGGHATAVLMLDLDRFKLVNDAFGHAAGDALLRAVARCLADEVGPGHLAARLGGDEFAVLLGRDLGPEATRALADRIARAVAAAVRVAGHGLEVGASVGVARTPAGGLDRSRLLAAADADLYRIKAERRGTRH